MGRGGEWGAVTPLGVMRLIEDFGASAMRQHDRPPSRDSEMPP